MMDAAARKLKVYHFPPGTLFLEQMTSYGRTALWRRGSGRSVEYMPAYWHYTVPTHATDDVLVWYSPVARAQLTFAGPAPTEPWE